MFGVNEMHTRQMTCSRPITGALDRLMQRMIVTTDLMDRIC